MKNNSGFRGTLPVFWKNIPIIGDTGSLDKERDQRVSHVVWGEADFEEVLEKIDAAIEGAGVIIPDTSMAKSQEVFYGMGLIDVVVQEVGVTPNLNVEYSLQDLRARLKWTLLGWALK